MARKTHTRKPRARKTKPKAPPARANSHAGRPAIPHVIYILLYAFGCYLTIVIMRFGVSKLEELRNGILNPILVNIIGVLQYILASMGPALMIASAFTLIEILLTKRARITTSYSLSFLNFILSYAGFVIAVFVFEKALGAINYEPIFSVATSSYGTLLTYLITLGYFFIGDVLLYWVHRLEHRNKYLWYLHKIHHAVEDMDSVSGAFHPLANIIRWVLTILPLSFIIEINLVDALILVSFLAGVHFVQHTRAPLYFGWFGRIIGDNRFHFIHHSKDPKHYNKNFAAIFPIIDMMFGTYLDPKAKTELPDTGLNDFEGAQTVSEFLSGKLRVR